MSLGATAGKPSLCVTAGVSGILGAAILALGRALGNDGSDNGDW